LGPRASLAAAAVAAQEPLGFDRARGQGIDPDVLVSVVDRHDLGELNQSAFGRAISCAPGAADAPKLRGDQDDRPAAASDHQGQYGAAE